MSADMILSAASIITMDPARPRASAVAIDSELGRIEAIGSLSECQAAAPDAVTTDLGDVVLMPGLIDPHSHPFVSGSVTQAPARWIAPYVGYPAWSDVQNLFRELEAETDPGEPLVFSGLDRMLQGAPTLDNNDLDEYFPGRPVVIVDNSGHEAYFNSEMIKMLGWADGPPPDPVGGSYGRHADGSSSGGASELPAVMAVVQPILAELTDNPLMPAALFYALMARNGITATSDLTYSTEYLPGYEALASSKDVPLRISLYHVSVAPDAGEPLVCGTSPDLLRKEGIKLWGDGSPWVGTIAISFPYLDTPTVRDAGIEPGPTGISKMNYSRLELDTILDKFAPQGWQMSFHVNGDVGIDVVLDAYQRALHKHGLIGTDHRWRIEHCGAGRADQFQRAASLGVTASLGAFQYLYWGDILDGTMFPSEIGSQWTQFKGAQDAGVQPTYHNDGSVSPPIPLLNIQTAITRLTFAGNVHGVDQIVSLDDALKAHTTYAARQLNREDDIGSITVGKLADFVELSMDPYLADPTRFANQIEVKGTWLSGRRINLDGFLQDVENLGPKHRDDGGQDDE